jgi:outer membrane protein OmpA-like peptidoglycan-associated protein
MFKITTKCKIIFLISMLIASGAVVSKNTLKDQFGVYGGGHLLFHDASFSHLPGLLSCCYEFNKGSGSGFELGGLYYMPFNETMVFQFKLGYSMYLSNFNQTEVIGNAYDYNYNTIDAVSEFNLDMKLGIIKFNPSILIKLFSAPLYINAGIEIGYVLSAGYDNSEKLISPSYAQFVNGSRTRTSSGSLEELTFPFLAAKAGLSYDMKLSDALVITPEAGINLNFANIVKNYNWKAHSLPYINLGFRFIPQEPPPPLPKDPPEPVKLLPPVPPEPPVLDAEIKAYYVTSGSKENDLQIIQIQEFLTRKIHPLLNYVFFAENSNEILPRYNIIEKNETSEFSDDKFFNRNTLDVYHDILNIIGHRLRKNQKAIITLTGCNSDENLEKSNITLSKNRADAIKNYLVNVWSIDPKRIKIESRNLPKQESNSGDKDGIEENRRVELSSNFEDIFVPLTIIDTVIETIPPVLRFRIKSKTKAIISEWTVSAYQRDKKLKTFNGSGSLPDVLEWDMAKEKEYIPLYNQPVYYKIEISDKEKRHWESVPQKLEIEPLTAKNKFLAIEKGVEVKDKEIDEFSLMSFAFNSPELNKEHKLILELATEKINDSSYVLIKGYTDRVGEEQHNMQLSLNRALSTATALNIDTKFVSGVGETEPLFDNNLPEGRFYNRAVYITIENPVKK